MCSILVEKYGIKVPGKEKEEAASLIIKLIPGLRDPLGKTGYVRIHIIYIILIYFVTNFRKHFIQIEMVGKGTLHGG